MSTRNITENDFSYRLVTLVDKISKGNVAEFSRSIKTPPPTIKRYIDGREPKIGLIIDIYNTHKVSPLWLLVGKGEMFLKENKKETNLGELIDEWAKSLIEAGSHTEQGLIYDLRAADKRIDIFIAKREKQGLQDNQISRKIA